MTDNLPLCPRPRCGRLIHDQAYVCAVDAGHLRRDLETVARTAGDAQDTILRLARQGSAAGPADERLDFDPHAADALDEAVNTLITWARHIHEVTGWALPVACQHSTCVRVRRGTVSGPECGRPTGHQLEVLTRWVAGQLDWLRMRPEADQAFDEIEDACRRLIRIVDRPPDRWYAGPCGAEDCTEPLEPVAGAKKITCPKCGAVHDPDERKAWLLDQIDEQETTAGAAAVALTALGCRVSADLVRQWAHRNQLLPRAGTKLYRIGDVRDLVVEAAHRDLDRRIRVAKKLADKARREVVEQEEMMVA